MFSSLAAIGSLVSAGTGLGSALFGGGAAKEQQKLTAANIANQQAQQIFANQLAAEGMKRSSAGYTDSLGNSYAYDPGSNTWKMVMGAAPEAAERAMYQASVQRNVNDMANQALANEMSMRAGTGTYADADAARRAVANFQPMGSGQLTSLLGKQIIDAQNRTQSPVLQGMLATAARTGTGFGQQVADYSRQQAQNVRDAITQSTLSGLQGTGQINQSNLTPLVNKFSALTSGSQPNLQQISINTQNPSKDLGQQLTTRAYGAGNAPFAGIAGAVGSADAGTKAAQLGAQNIAPDQLPANLKAAGSTLNDLFTNEKTLNTIGGWFGSTPQNNPFDPRNTQDTTQHLSNIFG